MSQHLFPEQRPDETITLIARPHWLVILPQLLLFVVMLVIPIAVLIALTATETGPFTGTARNFTVVLVPAWYLALFTWIFITWLRFYLDIGIVTDQRVIDIDQTGLFRRKVSELDLGVVQDVSAQKSGLLQTLVDYGDVHIQTAGEMPNFAFQGVPKPGEMSQRLSELCRKKSQEAEQKTDQPTSAPAATAEQTGSNQQSPESSLPQQPHDEAQTTDASSTPTKPTKPAPSGANETPPEPSSDELPREYER